MVNEKSYATAIDIYGEFARFFLATVEKVGLEKTLEINERAFEMNGHNTEAMLRQLFPDKVDLTALGEMFGTELNDAGFETEIIMRDKDTLVIRNTVCPKYDAFKAHGVEENTVKEICMRAMKVQDKYFKKVEPDLGFIIEWDAGNGCCDEIIIRT